MSDRALPAATGAGPLAWRLARRELRGGLAGFRVFLACLALGVAAIAGVGSFASAILEGMRIEGRAILGGDLEFRLVQRAADPAERAFLDGLGAVSTTVEMRAMAKTPDGDKRTVIELKAVDGAYPLYGSLALADGADPRRALGMADGRPGMVADATLADRLGLKPGDSVRLGDVDVAFQGVLAGEPDRLSGGLTVGPRVMVTMETLARTGLAQVGSLTNHAYRVRLAPGIDGASARAQAQRDFPQAGWRVRDTNEAAPQVKGFIERLALFLTLVGLTALTVGGVGVGNAVKAFLDGKTRVIATLKCLGATGDLIFSVYLLQILVIATLAVILGLVAGAALPHVAMAVIGDQLPVPARISLSPLALALAAIYGYLTALVFAVWPLARAREIPPAALFRDLIAPIGAWPRRRYLALIGGAGAALAGLAILQADDKTLAAGFIVAALASFAALRGAALALMALARRLPRPRRPVPRIALANLHRPGAPAPAIVLSLGLGLTLLVAVAAIQGNLAHEVRDNVGTRAPTFFFVDIQNDQLDAFRTAAAAFAPKADFASTPSLRGRIVKVKDQPAEDAPVEPEGRWALKGDRGVTYAATPPQGGAVVEGAFWPPDYAGPPLLSFDAALARAFHVGLGDTLTVNVMGREITGTIASLRKVDWSSGGINFILIFSPGVFEAAPHTHLATLRVAPGREEAAYRALTDAFPNVTAIRVKEAIDGVNAILEKLKTALMAASTITILAGVLVLGGAMAAGQRRRIHEAVVLKVLGMTRAQVLSAYLIEFAALGLVAALIAGAAGTGAAYVVVTRVMGGAWIFLPWTMIGTGALAILVTVGLGLSGTIGALSAKPAPVLRSP